MVFLIFMVSIMLSIINVDFPIYCHNGEIKSEKKVLEMV